jgi:hypothetical protein
MAWTSAVGYIDDLVKEFLIFRGFTSALRAFEAELRTEKEKGFRPDRWFSSQFPPRVRLDRSFFPELSTI